jgi:SpoVK/Ycf46/Vps4 family AAA+-type ATPase
VSDGDLLDSLRAAVNAAPDDVRLRLHLAELLAERGHADEAIRELSEVLSRDPASEDARALMTRLLQAPATGAAEQAEATEGFAWDVAEADLGSALPPMFVGGDPGESAVESWDVERADVTLDDVGGMQEVKERLEASFIAPLRNEELRKLYRKNLQGGLLLYGPPGCGKTFIARALAGELDASFISVSIHDVLDMWIGRSERNLHDIFSIARRNAPCVVFIDEIDALGRRRSQISSDGMRTTVNQLLSELDGVDNQNENVYVLAATNHPWDVDVALRRPGRFDRMVLVLPPDAAAREVILRTHLKDRPIAGVDAGRLAQLTEGFSGADLAHVCETAGEKAMMDAVRTGEVRMIEMRDLEAAVREVKPSTGPWFEAARNVVTFANSDGTYDDLLAYMKRRKLM